jgi:type IV pilus assembly protein PilV
MQEQKMTIANRSLKHTQQGLTLIEVLIAMLILAVGLLGMASLQVRAVQDTSNSSFRSVAIYYANDMADRIRSNPAGEAGNLYTSVNGGSEQTACLTTTGCNSSAMATHDKWEWQRNIAAALPAGTGALSRSGEVYTVTVSWTDRVEQGANNTATSDVNFSFEP